MFSEHDNYDSFPRAAALDAAIATEELAERLTVVRVIAMISLPLPLHVEQPAKSPAAA